MEKYFTLKKNIIFSLSILVIFFLLLEITANVYLKFFPIENKIWNPTAINGSIISDHQLNHKWYPSISVRIPARGYYSEIITNQQSWLEKYEISKQKPDNSYRIFYLGDSTTQGVADWDKSLVNLVEIKLNDYYKNSPHIEVINTGTSSYSTLLYYLLVRYKLLQFSPDLIVINVDMTDIVNDALYKMRLVKDEEGLPYAVPPFELKDKRSYRMTPFGIVKISKVGTWNQALYENISFYRVLHLLVSKVITKDPEVAMRHKWLPWQSEVDYSANWLAKEWNDTIEGHVGFSMDILRKTIALCINNGISVVVTGVPHYHQYSGNLSNKPHEVLQKEATQAGALYLNSFLALEKQISGTDVAEYYWKADPTHFNNAGNEIWAETQFNFLISHKGTILP